MRGDVVVTKSGQRYEGKVISEDATSVTMEYRPTPNTRDTRTINKSDIENLIRLTPSQAEFEELKLGDTLPTDDLLSSADYERIIQDQLRGFVNKHKGTPEAEKVEEMIKELSAEKERVSKGELKVDGKWLSAEDVRRDAYEIEAYRLRKAMNEAAAAKTETPYLNALRLFEQLQKQYPASINFVKGVAEAIEIIDNYTKQLNGMMAEQPILAKQREAGMKALTGPDASATKAAVEQEIASFKAQAADDKKNKVKWAAIYKYDLPSLKAALDVAIKERTNLGTLDVVTLQEENEKLTGILRSIADEKVAQARTQLAALPKATMINKTAVSMLERKVNEVEKELKERDKRDAGARLMARTTQSADGAAAEGEESSAQNALAEALKKAQEKSGSDSEKAKKEAEEAAKAASKPSVAMQVQDEGGGIADYIPYIGGVLVLVLVVAFAMGKKKPKGE